MNLNSFLEKLRTKPEHERERIAIFATGISFLIILAIWLVSFSEMNKTANKETNDSSVESQLEELGKGVSESKRSIEEMMQGLPQDSTGLENLNDLDAVSQGMDNQSQGQDINQEVNNNQNNQQGTPSSP